MKNAVMTAALLFAALGARAEMPQMLGTDPLSRQILTKTAQVNGGVTAAVRVGSGQVLELKLVDMTAAPFGAQMAPAALSPVVELKPASGLVPKVSKVKAKKAPRRAVDQLKHVSTPGQNWR
jgi:hypothetical protein